MYDGMKDSGKNIFFSSDHHYGHGNILKFSNRPFMSNHEQEIVSKYHLHKPNEHEELYKEYKNLRISRESIDRHDEALIANWNAKVPKDGVVYHLGDFSFDERKAKSIIERLNGSILLVKGNHDNNIGSFSHLFGWVKDYYELRIKDDLNKKGRTKIILCHYAMRVWNGSHHSSYMLYGHSHGSLPDDPNSLSFDVGVDCHNYSPISFEEVVKIMSKKTWKPVDHHGDNT